MVSYRRDRSFRHFITIHRGRPDTADWFFNRRCRSEPARTSASEGMGNRMIARTRPATASSRSTACWVVPAPSPDGPAHRVNARGHQFHGVKGRQPVNNRRQHTG